MDLVEATLLGAASTPTGSPSSASSWTTRAASEVEADAATRPRPRRPRTSHPHHQGQAPPRWPTGPATRCWAPPAGPGIATPYSCEAGNCATCMALVREGAVTMRANNALTPDEVEEGWVLTCQAEPTTTAVTVEFEAM